MFWKQRIVDVIGIAPKEFEKNIKSMVLNRLRETYEGSFDEDIGIVLVVNNVKIKSEGKIVPGEGNVYYEVEFDAYSLKPELNEVLYGEINDAVEFGAFIKIGSLEGLIHISQLMEDFVTYDPTNKSFRGKESHKVITVGNIVKARIISLSLRESIEKSKIGLTLRQPGLGKIIAFKKK